MNVSFYASPPYNTTLYSMPTRIFYIITGLLSMQGNLYIIFLFTKFPKLRIMQCNWLIIFLCIADALLGFGIFIRGIIYIYAMGNSILEFNYIMCSILTFPFSCGYRVGQTIGLLIALDRLMAIWMPMAYNKWQGNKVVLISAMITITVSGMIFFVFIYGMDTTQPNFLSTCFSPNGIYFSRFITMYSGVVSIVFFATYFASLILFSKHLSQTKLQQAHAQVHLTKVQRRIFVSVSLALLSYSIVYAIPSTIQLFSTYFGFSGPLLYISTYSVAYGAELNGCLNAVIYLIKHQEFQECSKKFVSGCLGKATIVGSKVLFLNNPNSTSRRS